MIYGYARVSSRDQNLDRQLIALREAGVPEENIVTDKFSGKDFNRPGWQDLVAKVQPGDLIIIKSIDRLGRNYDEILQLWQTLTKQQQVDIRILDMPLLDTTYYKDLLGTFVSDLVLQVLSFQAETERENIRQRQAEGIAAHRSGVKFGRPRKQLPENFEDLYQQYLQGVPVGRLAKDAAGMSESTFRLRIQERIDQDKAS